VVVAVAEGADLERHAGVLGDELVEDALEVLVQGLEQADGQGGLGEGDGRGQEAR
jgi:hypothetical protein